MNKSSLEILQDLIYERTRLTEHLERLRKMSGINTQQGTDSYGLARCGCIKLESSYSASVHLYRRDDTELMCKLVDTTISHLQEKLNTNLFLLGLAERAVAKALQEGGNPDEHGDAQV